MKKVILIDESASLKSQKNDTVIVDRNSLINFLEKSEMAPSVEFMKGLPNLRIDGKTIKEWFRYNNISLWWFVHPRIWPKAEKCIRFIDGLEIMLDKLRPQLIELRGFYDYHDLINQICSKKNVKLSVPFSSKEKIFFNKIKRKVRKEIVRTNLVSNRKERTRRKLAKEAFKKVSEIKENCVVYVSFQSYRRSIYDFKSDKILKGEHLVQRILDLVGEKKDLLCIDIDSTAKGEFNVLKERLGDKKQFWIPLEVLITDDIKSKCQKPIEKLLLNLRNLFKKTDFQKKINYKNINLWNYLNYYFETLLTNAYVPNFIKTIQAIKFLLEKIKPKSILLVYERGPYSLACNVAADMLGIKSIGLQHGVMDKRDHNYAIQDLSTKESDLNCPIPSKMLVYGEYYKELLINGASYPDDRISVVGYPAFEGINGDLTILKRTEILKNLGLDPSKKIILVATSLFQKYHGSEDYDVLMVKTLADKFGNNQNFQIILKPHPRENIKIYRQIINEKNLSNFQILQNPIQQLLVVCDMLVTVMTTAVLEAMVLKKPVLLVKVSENIDFDYLSTVKSGAAIEAKLDNLENKISKVIEDHELVSNMNKNAAKLVKYHFNFPEKQINEKIVRILIE